MNLTKRAAFLGSLAVLAGGLAGTSVATATTTAPATPCSMSLYSVSPQGTLDGNGITATKPPQNTSNLGGQKFTPGAVKAMTYWEAVLGTDGTVTSSALAVVGTTLTSQVLQPNGTLLQSNIGGGWGDYKSVNLSIWQKYLGSIEGHTNFYGLTNTGTITRWAPGKTWKKTGTYTGFASVKTLTLISQTATYDTFLANLRGGGLYTIQIPLASTSKTIVKQVRGSGWDTYDSLVAERCGQKGVLLTAIDKETGGAKLFAVGHATGTTTVIQDLGKLPGTLKNPVYSLVAYDAAGNFNGE
ncbi:hypothetical protein AB0P21_13250 [Kribbella sp. NPDC056861]|uniref:hypothetical protein n=1 Tax=Kribbella sp. NPDC056861 TaxID=3154857 RepID=UPI003439F1EE